MKVWTYPNGRTTMLTLLMHAGTPQQRALRVVREDRPASAAFAIQQARLQYGKDVPLAWLNQDTRVVTKVTEEES
jgi:hypothetical protein